MRQVQIIPMRQYNQQGIREFRRDAKRRWRIAQPLYLQFQQIISSESKISLINFLDSQPPEAVFHMLMIQNFFLQSMFKAVLHSRIGEELLTILNEWSAKHGVKIDQFCPPKSQLATKIKIKESSYQLRFLYIFNKEMIQYFRLEAIDIKTKNQRIQLLSNNLILIRLHEQYFFEDILSKMLIVQTNKKMILEMYELFFKNMKMESVKSFMAYYQQMLRKEVIWKDYRLAMSDNIKSLLENHKVVYLKELKFNIIHEIVRRNDITAFKRVLDLIKDESEAAIHQIIVDMFHQYSLSNETPLDLCLRCWPFPDLREIISFMEVFSQIKFTTNSLLKLLENRHLSQVHLEIFLQYFLFSESPASFLQLMKYQQYKNSKDYYFRTKFTQSICYDRQQLKINKVSKKCVLVEYLGKYRGIVKDSVIQMIKPECFNPQSIKKIIKITKKGKQNKQYLNQLSQILRYYQQYRQLCVNLYPTNDVIFDYLLKQTFMQPQFWPKFLRKFSIREYLISKSANQLIDKEMVLNLKMNSVQMLTDHQIFSLYELLLSKKRPKTLFADKLLKLIFQHLKELNLVQKLAKDTHNQLNFRIIDHLFNEIISSRQTFRTKQAFIIQFMCNDVLNIKGLFTHMPSYQSNKKLVDSYTFKWYRFNNINNFILFHTSTTESNHLSKFGKLLPQQHIMFLDLHFYENLAQVLLLEITENQSYSFSSKYKLNQLTQHHLWPAQFAIIADILNIMDKQQVEFIHAIFLLDSKWTKQVIELLTKLIQTIKDKKQKEQQLVEVNVQDIVIKDKQDCKQIVGINFLQKEKEEVNQPRSRIAKLFQYILKLPSQIQHQIRIHGLEKSYKQTKFNINFQILHAIATFTYKNEDVQIEYDVKQQYKHFFYMLNVYEKIIDNYKTTDKKITQIKTAQEKNRDKQRVSSLQAELNIFFQNRHNFYKSLGKIEDIIKNYPQQKCEDDEVVPNRKDSHNSLTKNEKDNIYQQCNSGNPLYEYYCQLQSHLLQWKTHGPYHLLTVEELKLFTIKETYDLILYKHIYQHQKPYQRFKQLHSALRMRFSSYQNTESWSLISLFSKIQPHVDMSDHLQFFTYLNDISDEFYTKFIIEGITIERLIELPYFNTNQSRFLNYQNLSVKYLKIIQNKETNGIESIKMALCWLIYFINPKKSIKFTQKLKLTAEKETSLYIKFIINNFSIYVLLIKKIAERAKERFANCSPIEELQKEATAETQQKIKIEQQAYIRQYFTNIFKNKYSASAQKQKMLEKLINDREDTILNLSSINKIIKSHLETMMPHFCRMKQWAQIEWLVKQMKEIPSVFEIAKKEMIKLHPVKDILTEDRIKYQYKSLVTYLLTCSNPKNMQESEFISFYRLDPTITVQANINITKMSPLIILQCCQIDPQHTEYFSKKQIQDTVYDFTNKKSKEVFRDLLNIKKYAAEQLYALPNFEWIIKNQIRILKKLDKTKTLKLLLTLLLKKFVLPGLIKGQLKETFNTKLVQTVFRCESMDLFNKIVKFDPQIFDKIRSQLLVSKIRFNLSLVNSKILIEIICKKCFERVNQVENELKYKYLLYIIKTSSIKIVETYLLINQLTVNQKLFEKFNTFSIFFIDQLLNFCSETFLVQFFKKYAIFSQIIKSTLLSNSFLVKICELQKYQLLQLALDYFKSKKTKTLFIQGLKEGCGISEGGVWTLPMDLAKRQGFYAYFYLLKYSQGQDPEDLILDNQKFQLFEKLKLSDYLALSNLDLKNKIYASIESHYDTKGWTKLNMDAQISLKIDLVIQEWVKPETKFLTVYLVFNSLFRVEEQFNEFCLRKSHHYDSLNRLVKWILNPCEELDKYQLQIYECLFFLLTNKGEHQIPTVKISAIYPKEWKTVELLHQILTEKQNLPEEIALKRCHFSLDPLKELLSIYNPELYMTFFEDELLFEVKTDDSGQIQFLVSLSRNDYKQLKDQLTSNIEYGKLKVDYDFKKAILVNLPYFMQNNWEIYQLSVEKWINLLQVYEKIHSISRYFLFMDALTWLMLLKWQLTESEFNKSLPVIKLAKIYQQKFNKPHEYVHYFLQDANIEAMNKTLRNLAIIYDIRKEKGQDVKTINDINLKSEVKKIVQDYFKCRNSRNIENLFNVQNIGDMLFSLFNESHHSMPCAVMNLAIAINIKLIQDSVINLFDFVFHQTSEIIKDKATHTKLATFMQDNSINSLKIVLSNNKIHKIYPIITQSSDGCSFVQIPLTYQLISGASSLQMISLLQDNYLPIKQGINKHILIKKVPTFQAILNDYDFYTRDLLLQDNNFLFNYTYKFEPNLIEKCPSYLQMIRIFDGGHMLRKFAMMFRECHQEYSNSVKIENNVFQMEMTRHERYAFEDIYGPLGNMKDLTIETFSDYLTFYEILELELEGNADIYLLSETQLKSVRSNQFEDIAKYCLFAFDTFQEKQPKIHTVSKIYFSFNENDEVTIDATNFSMYNVWIFFKQTQKIQFQLRVAEDYKVKLSIYSLSEVLQSLKTHHESKTSFKSLLNELISKSQIQQLRKLMISCLFDSLFIKDVKYIIIKYQQNKNMQKSKHRISEHIDITDIIFGKKGETLFITLSVNIHSSKIAQNLSQTDKVELFDRLQYLNQIASKEQIVNIFLRKAELNIQASQLSQKIAKELKNNVNIYINYSLIYNFIDNKMKTHNFGQIEEFLHSIYYRITNNYSFELEYFLTTRYQQNRYTNLIYCLFESIQKEKPLSYFQTIYELQLQQNKEFLVQEITRFDISNEYIQKKRHKDYRDDLKNSFLLQITKNGFKSMKYDGIMFLIKYNRNNFMYKDVSKLTDLKSVNMNDIEIILMITKTIPKNSEFNHTNILKIFYSDATERLFVLNMKKKLLDFVEKEDSFDPISACRLMEPSICLSLGKPKQNTMKKDEDMFYIDLQTNFQQKRIVINTERGQDITVINRFKLQKDNAIIFNKLDEQYQAFFNKPISLMLKTKLHLKSDNKIELLSNSIGKSFLIFFETFFKSPIMNKSFISYQSIEAGVYLSQNIFTLKRREIFEKIIEKICIQLCKTDDFKVKIQQKMLNLQIGTQSNFFNFDYELTRKILLEIWKNAKAKCDKQEVAHKYKIQQLTNEEILTLIDLVTIIDWQINEIILSLKLVKAISKKDLDYKLQIINDHHATNVIVEKNTLIIRINVGNPQRHFFTANSIVNLVINPYQLVDNYNTTNFIQYDSLKKEIIITNLCQNEESLKLFTFDTHKLITEKLKCSLKENKLVSPFNYKGKQKKIFFVYCPSNHLCLSNYFFNIDFEKNQFIIDKNESILQSGNTYQLILRSNYLQQKFQYIKINNEVLKNADRYNIKKMTKNISIIELESKDSQQIFMIKIEQQHIINLKKPQLTQYKFQFFSEGDNNSININELHFTRIQSNHSEVKIGEEYKTNLQFSNRAKKYAYFEEDVSIITSVQFRQNLKKIANPEKMSYTVDEDDIPFITRAGEKRIDFIQIRQNKMAISHTKVNPKAFFIHTNTLTEFQVRIIQRNDEIGLEWCPTIRGSYRLFINDCLVKTQHEIGVCAGQLDLSILKYDLPKQEKLNYNEEYTIKISNFKDKRGNIFSSLESAKFIKENLHGLFKLQAEEKYQKDLNLLRTKIFESGAVELFFQMSNLEPNLTIKHHILIQQRPEEAPVQKKDVSKIVEQPKPPAYKLLTSFPIIYQGSSLIHRKKKMEQLIYSNGYSIQQNLVINRNSFLEDIMKIAQNEKLSSSIRIEFKNEPGIDAGGLKREFYDMIGNQMKSQKNGFFKIYNKDKGSFFYSPAILQKKNRILYMQIWGKYIANSIQNRYLTGIKFSTPFVKMLYNEPIFFEDLYEISEPTEMKNYQELLKMSDKELSDMCLCFAQGFGSKVFDLKPNGSNIEVTSHNIKQYLNLKAQYLIKTRFEGLTQAFAKGFKEQLDLSVIKKWIHNNEFWCLTTGNYELTPELVLNSINFTGHNIDKLTSWVKRYIEEASQELLVGFLKFTTSSSCLQYNMGQTINVAFDSESHNNNNRLYGANQTESKLPVSHTCFKSIEVPRYQSYDELKKKFDLAFLHCNEGFGMG